MENDTLLFRMNIDCTKNPNEDDVNPYLNSVVKSKDLKWVPIGDQKKLVGSVRPVHDDILIAKSF